MAFSANVTTLAGVALWWGVWAFPFLVAGSKPQRRPSVVAWTPSIFGIALEATGVALAWAQIPHAAPALWRVALAMAAMALGVWLAWGSIRALGRQFRVQAGVYEDHALVRHGPYALVRHPIFLSLLLMMSGTLLLRAGWRGAALALGVHLLGTEIRIRTEERLLGDRFGAEFEDYRARVRGYIPFVR